MDDILTPAAAARQLGISVTTFYSWLGESDVGQFVLRGHPTTIRYFQGGPKGQGRIRIEQAEVERLLELMVVEPQRIYVRSCRENNSFPGITVPLGRPK